MQALPLGSGCRLDRQRVGKHISHLVGTPRMNQLSLSYASTPWRSNNVFSLNGHKKRLPSKLYANSSSESFFIATPLQQSCTLDPTVMHVLCARFCTWASIATADMAGPLGNYASRFAMFFSTVFCSFRRLGLFKQYVQ